MVDVVRDGSRRGRAPANKGKTYPVEIFTPDEVRALAAQCSTTSSHGIRHRALIVLLYRTGLRIGEALALRPKDLNLEIGATTDRYLAHIAPKQVIETMGKRAWSP